MELKKVVAGIIAILFLGGCSIIHQYLKSISPTDAGFATVVYINAVMFVAGIVVFLVARPKHLLLWALFSLLAVLAAVFVGLELFYVLIMSDIGSGMSGFGG